MSRTALSPRLGIHRGRYKPQADRLLEKVRQHYIYPPGENRASGYLSTDMVWVEPIVDDLAELLGIRFTILALQGYKDGTAGTAWHADDNFGDQAILSLGVTRLFGIRRGGLDASYLLDAGDLVHMPSGLEHRIIPQPDISGERVALVFRMPAQ